MTAHEEVDDESSLAHLLDEVGLAGSGSFNEALRQLRQLGADDAPIPSPQLASLFTASVIPLRPRLRRRKALVATAAIIGLMGAGVGTAAAVSPEFRALATEFIASLVNRAPMEGDRTGGLQPADVAYVETEEALPPQPNSSPSSTKAPERAPDRSIFGPSVIPEQQPSTQPGGTLQYGTAPNDAGSYVPQPAPAEPGYIVPQPAPEEPDYVAPRPAPDGRDSDYVPPGATPEEPGYVAPQPEEDQPGEEIPLPEPDIADDEALLPETWVSETVGDGDLP